MAANLTDFARRVFNDVFIKSKSNSRRLVSIFDQKMKINLCSRCLCSHLNNKTSRYNGEKRGLDKPQKRKVLRKIKAEIYTRNILDPDMEKAARTRKLLVPLDHVKSGWIPKEYPHQVMTMALYYGIYEHMFDGMKFTPRAVMDIDFGEKVGVHYGNFIEPVECPIHQKKKGENKAKTKKEQRMKEKTFQFDQVISGTVQGYFCCPSCSDSFTVDLQVTTCEPQVNYDGTQGSLTTLLMVNLDGNILSENHEILHWMIGNIPNGDVKKGQILSGYLPPCPVRGTGFHRFVFCLLEQNAECNFEEMYRTRNPRNLISRSFRTRTFLQKFQGQLDPVGLSFFQATWDKTVPNTFTEILGTKEPMYDLEPFLTPNQKKKLKVQDVFGKKYKNM